MSTVMSVDSTVTAAEGGSGYTYSRDIVRIVIVRDNYYCNKGQYWNRRVCKRYCSTRTHLYCYMGSTLSNSRLFGSDC